MAVSVVFAEGSVRLILGGDTVGAWPLSEVQFLPAESGYELVAEGDSLPFVPHDRNAFASFVQGSEPIEEPAPSSAPIEDRQVADPGGGASAPIEDRQVADPGGSPAPEPEVRPAGMRADDEPGFYAGLEPEFAALDENPPSLLDLEDEPDEFFAAGLNGPPSEGTAPTFRSPLFEEPHTGGEDAGPGDAATPPKEAMATPENREIQDEPAVPEVDDEPTPSFGLGRFEGETSTVNGHGDPWSKESVNGSDSELTTRPNGSPSEEPEWTDDSSDVPPSSMPEVTPSTDYPDNAPEDTDPLDVPEAEDGAAGGFLGRFRARAGRPKGPDVQDEEQRVDDGASLTNDDTPQPIDDAENLRQWGLVAAGGLVITVVAVMVIWGLASILGGDGDPVEQGAPATTVATAPPETAPPPEPTTPTVVSTSAASPENIAAAQAFVSDWNSLASQYANQLSISADSLPISVAPEPTIHLTYDEDGILRLKMAPRGNGNDRDILLAMGLAIAWADPDVSPEGRKSLLADLGVDVDDPVLTNMGGEVSRSGITYRTTVDEAILTFEVDPTV